ncbi:MAG: hypothetical protein Q8N62_04310 [Candidatus Omnitrophota bacterium]|nr:hypothetical protein [Candidatus Omnitrophota bacterium]
MLKYKEMQNKYLGWKASWTLEEGIKETIKGIEIASALRASQ